MIDLNTEEGRSKVAEMFAKDLQHPVIQMALYRSFRKYATLRDQLIDEYVTETRLPREFFEDVIAKDLAKEFIG